MAPRNKPTGFRLIDPPAKVEEPFDDLQFIQAHFAFETELARGTAVVNLSPADGIAAAWTLHTVLEGLINHPDTPQHDGHMTGSLSWNEQRNLDTSYESESPDVVISESRSLPLVPQRSHCLTFV